MKDRCIQINMPESVKYIINTLENKGYEGYIVGGCVRDSLLGREPKDWDITTSAQPQDVIKIFESLQLKVIPTGIKHGTVTVMIGKEGFEITTFRIDGEYEDSRHPKEVKYTDKLIEDLSRRDFTINSMAFNEQKGLIDYFGGLDDLDNKLIRCVGDAFKRLEEDKLRVLRVFRFASRYNFDIHNHVYNAIAYHNDIRNISKERVREEFNKILLCDKPSKWLHLMYKYDLLSQIVPELLLCYDFDQNNPHHDKNVFNHILSVVDNIEPKLELRLSALFHDIGKPQTFSVDEKGIGHFYSHQKESAKLCEVIMKRLKYSNKEIEDVRELVYWHMVRCDYTNQKAVKKFIRNIGVDRLESLFKLKIADICGSCLVYDDFEDVFRIKFACEKVLNEKQPLTVKDLDINGYDLMELGFKGKEIGQTLNKLLDKVLDNSELNTKEQLLGIVKELEM